MNRPLHCALYTALATLLIAGRAVAQVGEPSAEDLEMSPLDVPGGSGFRSKGLSEEPGLADPRDFSGRWDTEGNVAGFFAMRNGRGAPKGLDWQSAARPPPQGGPGAPDRIAGIRATQTAKLACIPAGGPTSGGDGPVEIVQTDEQLTWMAEEMHAIRRIFLKGDFTPGLAPSYNGESIGRFDGDTLVVETRGMKSLPPGARLIERIRKSEQGRLLRDEITQVDADGKPTGPPRVIELYFRPKAVMLEWICEDNGQIYQPGVYDKVL